VKADEMKRLRRAVFLDRDGVVLRLVPYLSREEEMELLPGVGEHLCLLKSAGFALVVITNQSVVARGILTLSQLNELHETLRDMLSREGVTLDGIYACPHHPDFTGPCECRKPEPGMLKKAAEDLRLDLRSSYLVGDRWDDIEAARRVGAKGLLVMTGYGQEESRRKVDSSTPVLDDLPAAVRWILNVEGASDPSPRESS
jgi:histidinol-phosphate phosphatase family protein